MFFCFRHEGFICILLAKRAVFLYAKRAAAIVFFFAKRVLLRGQEGFPAAKRAVYGTSVKRTEDVFLCQEDKKMFSLSRGQIIHDII